MQDIVADKQANEGVRKSAVILLKNLVEKRWRRASANAVADDEKQLVRQRLLLLFDEQNDTVRKSTHVLKFNLSLFFGFAKVFLIVVV